jgi:hypothetical protein
MIGIICDEVTSRYVFNAPTIWVIEVGACLFCSLCQSPRRSRSLSQGRRAGWTARPSRVAVWCAN